MFLLSVKMISPFGVTMIVMFALTLTAVPTVATLKSSAAKRNWAFVADPPSPL